METLTQALAAAIEPSSLDPIVFFGHCSGAWIAYELVRELRRTGVAQPTELVVASQVPPRRARHDPTSRALPTLERVRSLGVVDARILEDDDLSSALAPILAADFGLLDTYEWEEEPPLEIPILICRPSEEEERAELFEEWAAETVGPCRVVVVEGERFFSGSSWDALAASVGRHLLGQDGSGGGRLVDRG
jgi:medium-chain acyl-[acyl-carrier-protein] hydrolase